MSVERSSIVLQGDLAALETALDTLVSCNMCTKQVSPSNNISIASNSLTESGEPPVDPNHNGACSAGIGGSKKGQGCASEG